MALSLAARMAEFARSILAGGGSVAAVKAALGIPSSMVINRVVATNSTWSAFSTVIPLDDTIPQSSEGSQILSATITPKSGSSALRIRTELHCATQTANGAVCAAIFDGGANALKATWRYGQPNYGGVIVLTHEYTPGVTTAVTITVRMGAGSGSYGVSINGGTGRIFGGVMACRLEVEELSA